MGRYAEPAARILMAYAGNHQAMIAAIEALCETAKQHAQMMNTSEMAMAVCQGLHANPAASLACAQCVEAERGLIEEANIEAEMEAVRRAKEKDGE